MSERKLEKLRKKIDAADIKLVGLIAERLEAAEKIGHLKRLHGAKVEDGARRKGVMDNVSLLAQAKGLRPEMARKIIAELVAEAEGVQKEGKMVVAFQGERGAYSELAVNQQFKEKALLPCETFRQVFDALEAGDADYAVLPIENSTEGSVNQVYDLLNEYAVGIHAESFVRVRHCLLALEGASLAGIEEVISHPQALAQCSKYVEEKLAFARVSAFYDTAGAAKAVSEGGKTGVAAIASEEAGRYYGLKFLAEGIEDNRSNYTRFLLLSKKPTGKIRNPKSSIVFTLKHKAGSLFSALQIFAERGVNLTKIESRPTKETPWEYLFYMDFEGDAASGKCQEAVEKLKESSEYIKVLGTYEIGEMETKP